MQALQGKTAIVTGASAPNGIGRATSLQLAKEGARVVVTDMDGALDSKGDRLNKLDLLQGLVGEITNAGGEAIAVELDVTSKSDIDQCVLKAEQSFQSVDILVNNAGSLAGTGDFLNTTAEEWVTSFNVNLLGVMMLCQAAIPHMRLAGGGSIVNVGSTGSLGAEPGFGAYTTMKHGLIGLTKLIAAEFGPDNIRCNAVCPGYTETDMHMAVNERLAAEQNVSLEAIKQKRYETVAMRRAGKPAEVAKAISYLVSDSAEYVTGVALPVSGGVPYGI